MRVEDKIGLTGKELFDYLKSNESKIIETKMSSLVKSMPIVLDPKSDFLHKNTKHVKIKNHKAEEVEDPNGLSVKVVANVAGWLDHDMDVIVRGAYTETVQNDKNSMVHIHDHIHKAIAKVGIVKDVAIEEIALSDLGLSGAGSAEALIFFSEIRKEFNESIFNQYKLKAVNQHSIGFRYVDICLCINDADYPMRFDNWNNYIGQVINREKAEERGYFWAVKKVKVFENSTVLFGANELTPTLATEELKDQNPSANEKEDNNEEEDNNFKLLY